jgi:hypothetical protein
MARNIDLHGRRRRRAADTFTARGVALMALALGLGFAAIAWTDARRAALFDAQAAADRVEVERLQRLLRQMPADAGKSDSLAGEEREVLALETVAARLSAGVLGRAGSFTDTLKALGRSTTDGVWLTGIRLHQASGRMALEGKALDASRVPALVAALGQQPQFAGTAFAALDIKRDDGAGRGANAAGAPDPARADGAVAFRLTSTDSVPGVPRVDGAAANRAATAAPAATRTAPGSAALADTVRQRSGR